METNGAGRWLKVRSREAPGGRTGEAEVGADGVFSKADESGGMTCVNEALSRYSPTRKERGRALTSTGQNSCPLFSPLSPKQPLHSIGEEGDGKRSLMGASKRERERERGRLQGL